MLKLFSLLLVVVLLNGDVFADSLQIRYGQAPQENSSLEVSSQLLGKIKKQGIKSDFIKKSWAQLVPDHNLAFSKMSCEYNGGYLEYSTKNILCKIPFGYRPYEVCLQQDEYDQCMSYSSAPEYLPSSFYFRAYKDGSIDTERSAVIQKSENFEYNSIFCHFFDACAG